MRIAYFDCSSGISGDMVLGAFLDAGLKLKTLTGELSKLRLKGYELKVRKITRAGLAGTKFDCITDKAPHADRPLKEIISIIERSSLNRKVKEMSKEIFLALGQAERKVHGFKTDDSVHLHELGDIDSIIDIVGAAIAIDKLEIDALYSSYLSLGRGIIKTKGGTLPLPAPASVELLKGIPLKIIDFDAELVTPTGAAILKTLSKGFGEAPLFDIACVGYGAGAREFGPSNTPNVLRLIIGETADKFDKDSIVVVNTNIDDMSPLGFEHTYNELFEAGALDAYSSSVYMKKSRPGFELTVLVKKADLDKIARVLFKETTAIGLRFYEAERLKLKREIRLTRTPYGSIRVKVSNGPGGISTVSPEHDDCVKAARAAKVPFRDVYDTAKQVLSSKNRPFRPTQLETSCHSRESGNPDSRLKHSGMTQSGRAVKMFILLAMTILFYPLSIHADTIVTNDGRELKGIVVEDYKDRITFSTADGEINVMKKDISELALDNEEDNLLKLGEQAFERKDYERSFAYYEIAFKLNPQSKQAKDGLLLLQGYLFRKEEAKKEEAVMRQAEVERSGTYIQPEESDSAKKIDDIKKLKDAFGMLLGLKGNTPEVISISSDSPAYDAGLRMGDLIVAIWGRLTGYTSLEEVIERLMEKSSMEVKCTIERAITIPISGPRHLLATPNDMIGAAFKMEFDGLTIASAGEGDSAFNMGLRKGDLVVAIDEFSTRYLPLNRAVELIRNAKNDAINLTIRREVTIWRR